MLARPGQHLAVLLSATLVLGACSTGDEPASTGSSRPPALRVIASFYPVAEAARSIGGARVSVSDLTAAGAEPHAVEPTAPQLVEIERADLALYLGNGFQPAVEKAVLAAPSSVQKADLLNGMRLREAEVGIAGVRGEVDGGRGPESLQGGRDPHVWVDPAGFIAMARRIQRALIAADRVGRRTYDANARRYLTGLRALDGDFRRGLRRCRSDVLVTSHAAFGYLADRYDLKQAAIAGLSPEAEPDPRSLAATARYAKANNVTTVFFETLVPRRLADTVAREIGARTDALDPVESLTQRQLDGGESYSSIQHRNLAAMRSGLRCTA